MIQLNCIPGNSCPSPSNVSIIDCEHRNATPQKVVCTSNNVVNSNNVTSSSITLFRTSTKSATTTTLSNVRNVTTTKVVFGQASVGGTTRHPIQTSLISHQPVRSHLSNSIEIKAGFILYGKPIISLSEIENLIKIWIRFECFQIFNLTTYL